MAIDRNAMCQCQHKEYEHLTRGGGGCIRCRCEEFELAGTAAKVGGWIGAALGAMVLIVVFGSCLSAVFGS